MPSNDKNVARAIREAAQAVGSDCDLATFQRQESERNKDRVDYLKRLAEGQAEARIESEHERYKG